MATLGLTFLGGFDVLLDQQPLTNFRSVNVQGLLAFLALEANTVHQRTTIAALFWPEEDESTARHNLRQSLYQLRRLVGNDYLLITRQTVQFNRAANYVLDVDDFVRGLERKKLSVAETIYAGDLLAGFSCDSAEFELWLTRRRERLHRLALTALHELTQQRLNRGKDAYAQALTSAQRQLALEPWNEAAHRQLMEALARTGDRAAAVAQFDRCAEVLVTELGVSPAPETLALFEAIRDGLIHQDQSKILATKVHNLPRQTTPFFGRSVEIARLQKLLSDTSTPLVTLTGPGGMGKTRLALEVLQKIASETPDLFSDGIFVVPLVSLQSPSEIPIAVADAIGFLHQQPDAPIESLVHYLRGRRLLLLLDNFEHLLPDGNDLLAALLRRTEDVQLCVTSRQRLGLSSETILPVEGLPIDAEDSNDPLANPAAQLFLHSARRGRGTLEVRGPDQKAVVQIARRTNGIPLALVLAAAWADTLPLRTIAAQINEDRDFLDSDAADLPLRQRSMRSVFTYSWQQLDKAERDVFSRLTIFRGGFTRRAARDITGGSLKVLANLVRKSLVAYNGTKERYQVHELLRQFGREHLETQPAAAVVELREQHSRYYLTAIADRAPDVRGVDQFNALRDIAIDAENVQAAWQTAIKQNNWTLLGGALDALYLYYYFSGRELVGAAHFQQTREQITAYGESAPAAATLINRLQLREFSLTHLLIPPPVEALARLQAQLTQTGSQGEIGLLYKVAAHAAVARGDVRAAIQNHSAQLAVWQQLGDTLHAGLCQTDMAQLFIVGGQIEQGLAAARQAMALQQASGDLLGGSVTHLTLGSYHALWAGDYAAAARHFAEAYEVGMHMRIAGHLTTGVVVSRVYQAFLALLRGDADAVRAAVKETTELADRKNTTLALAMAATHRAIVALCDNNLRDAAAEARESLSLSRRPGIQELAQIVLALVGCCTGDVRAVVEVVLPIWQRVVLGEKLPERALLVLLLPTLVWSLNTSNNPQQAANLLALGRSHSAWPDGLWQLLPVFSQISLPQAQPTTSEFGDVAVELLDTLADLG